MIWSSLDGSFRQWGLVVQDGSVYECGLVFVGTTAWWYGPGRHKTRYRTFFNRRSPLPKGLSASGHVTIWESPMSMSIPWWKSPMVMGILLTQQWKSAGAMDIPKSWIAPEQWVFQGFGVVYSARHSIYKKSSGRGIRGRHGFQHIFRWLWSVRS